MKNFQEIFCVLFISSLFFFSCSQEESQKQGGQYGETGVQDKLELLCENRFSRLDTDGDKKVSPEEFEAADYSPEEPEIVFEDRDINQDGYLTEIEFCASSGIGQKKRQQR